MTDTDPSLIFTQRDAIAVIELNRPEKKNAIGLECLKLLDSYFERLSSESTVRALVITGRTHGVFSAGIDVHPEDPFIADMLAAIQNNDRKSLTTGFAFLQGVLTRLARLPFPTIAAINGLCYSGGLELALACDIRVASQDAVFCFQETRLGLIPDLGGTVRLQRLIGPGRAKELIFSSRKFSPQEAMTLGLVNHVFPKENFDMHLDRFIENLKKNSPAALKVVKEIIDSTHGLDETNALEIERIKAVDNLLSGQCIEGIAAFLEKRKPCWP